MTTPTEPTNNDDLATFARHLFGKDKTDPEPTDDPDRAYVRTLFTDND